MPSWTDQYINHNNSQNTLNLLNNALSAMFFKIVLQLEKGYFRVELIVALSNPTLRPSTAPHDPKPTGHPQPGKSSSNHIDNPPPPRCLLVVPTGHPPIPPSNSPHEVPCRNSHKPCISHPRNHRVPCKTMAHKPQPHARRPTLVDPG